MTRLTRVLALFFLAAVVAFAVGCGGDDSSDDSGDTTSADSGSDVSAIQEEVDELTQRPTEIPITEPIEGGIPESKTIAYLQCSVPICVELGENLTAATDALGWKTDVIDEGATPETVQAAWAEAVRRKPDAVVMTGGFPRDIYAAELEELNKAGIPVIGHSEAEPADPQAGIVSVASGPERQVTIGENEAKWIISDTDGAANTLFIDSGFPINSAQLAALTDYMSANCPDCTVTDYQAPIESIGTDLAGRVASQAQRNPDTNYIVAAFGDMAIGISDALAGQGIDPIPMVSQEVSPANVPEIRDGVLTAMLYGSGPESMWGIADTLVRYFNDEEYPEEIPLVNWIITQDNVPEGDTFPGVEDYQEQFEALWGVN